MTMPPDLSMAVSPPGIMSASLWGPPVDGLQSLSHTISALAAQPDPTFREPDTEEPQDSEWDHVPSAEEKLAFSYKGHRSYSPPVSGGDACMSSISHVNCCVDADYFDFAAPVGGGTHVGDEIHRLIAELQGSDSSAGTHAVLAELEDLARTVEPVASKRDIAELLAKAILNPSGMSASLSAVFCALFFRLYVLFAIFPLFRPLFFLFSHCSCGCAVPPVRQRSRRRSGRRFEIRRPAGGARRLSLQHGE